LAGKRTDALAGIRTPVRPRKMADQVAAQIRRMIAHGELVDGDWLPAEPELMQRFGVSRPTLREALRLLESESLVTIRRGPPGGARVTIPGPDAVAGLFGLVLTLSGTTIADVWDARMTIEPAAVRRLAESATDEVLAQVDAALDEVRAAIDDTREFSRAGARLHVRLVELSGNHTLAAVIAMLAEIIERELAKSLDEIGPDTDEARRADLRALRSYEKTIEFIRTRDGEGAEKAWRDHMRNARRYIASTHKQDRVIDLLY